MRNIGRRLREARSVRAFAFEVLIVVVGVLIALGAQQLVEDWTWRQRVAAGEQRLKDEAYDNVYALAEQIVVAPCVDAQLAILDEKLRKAGNWNGIATFPSPMSPMVIRMPARPLDTELWNTLGTEGTALYFDDQRALRTATYYKQMHILSVAMQENFTKTTEFNFLARPTQLSSDTRAALLAKIGAIRSSTVMQGLIAVQAMESLHRLGRLKEVPVIEADLNALRADPIGTIAVCAERKLPLGNWQAALHRRIADMKAFEKRQKIAPK